jgi:hypothetical protein
VQYRFTWGMNIKMKKIMKQVVYVINRTFDLLGKRSLLRWQ